MANPEHMEILKQGVEVWNRWRDENPKIRPDLSRVEFHEAGLHGAYLRWANLQEAVLVGADLSGANISRAFLVGELQPGNKPKYNFTAFSTVPFPGGVDGKDTTVHKFKQCPDGIDVELWEMANDIPHPPLFFRYGANGIKELAEKSWEFLQSHKR